MEPVSSTGTGFPMWFPATIEWIDGSGDFCRATLDFFLEQNDTEMSAYQVCAVVEHYNGYKVAITMGHLHEFLSKCFGTPLAPDEPGDELTQDWA